MLPGVQRSFSSFILFPPTQAEYPMDLTGTMQYIEGVVNSRLPRSKAFGAAVFLRRWSRKSSDFRIDFIDVILKEESL